MKRMLLVAVLLIVSSADLSAESLMWKIEKGGEFVYIGGTIHVLRSSDYPVPGTYDDAFCKADILVLEADYAAVNSPETQQKILAGGMYPAGEGLDKVLSEEAYGSLEEYCSTAGIPIQAMIQLKPSLVLFSLLGIELQKLQVSPEYGIDKYYYDLAVKEGKEMVYLETADEQIAYILSMGEGQESELVLNSISDMHKLPEQMDDMILFWKTGNDRKLAELLVSEMKDNYPDLYRTFITDRNDRWLPEIESMFRTEEDELVLVGSAHLVGSDGIISLLKKRGYKVEKFK